MGVESRMKFFPIYLKMLLGIAKVEVKCQCGEASKNVKCQNRDFGIKVKIFFLASWVLSSHCRS